MRSQEVRKLQYPAPNSDGKKKDLLIHIVDNFEREPKYLINYLKQIEFPKSTPGFNLTKEVVKESNKLDFIDLFSLINIAEIKDENSRSELFIDFVEKKGPIFNKGQIADMARSLGIQQESTLQDLQRLPTKKFSFEVARSSSDTKEQEQQKMLALINETKSFLDFTMIVEMGIKNGYTKFQGDDNKIELIRAFLVNPRERSDITISQFSNFVTNIEISDQQKKDKLFKEFFTKNQIGKILSSKEELKTSQHEEPAIEIRSIQISQMPDNPAIEIPSTPTSPSNQNAIEIRSTPVSPSNQNAIEIQSISAYQLSEPSMIASHSFQKPQLIPESQRLNLPLPQKRETPPTQLFQNKEGILLVTSELLFAPSDPNHQPPHSTQQQINNNSNQTSFRAQPLINTKSNKCCIIL